MSDTLILNADGLPLSVVPLSTLNWQAAIKLQFLENAEVLAHYEDWDVHSPSTTIQVPAVLLLRDYVKVNRGVKFSRANVLLRDDYQCQYCGKDCKHDKSLLTLDHVVPRFHGGKTRWENVVAACGPCNLEKAHFMNMKPKCGTPKRPDYYQLVAKAQQMPIEVPHESWAQFTGWNEDLVTVKAKRRRRTSIL
jgi:5-methylcytosine-specific restriction endonuclease McrA